MASPKQPCGGLGGAGGLSEGEDEAPSGGGGGGKGVKLSDIFSTTTIPSVDSAVESWDGSSAIDNTFNAQRESRRRREKEGGGGRDGGGGGMGEMKWNEESEGDRNGRNPVWSFSATD